jgi:methylthioribose-1-phosphate isomerase
MPRSQGVRTIEWLGDRVRFVDQSRLPEELATIETRDYRVVAEAIKRLEVRGAPAIGVAAALGVALAANASGAGDVAALERDVETAAAALESTRPTAVNLRWAVARMREAMVRARASGPGAVRAALVREAVAVLEEDRKLCRLIGESGAPLIADGDTVLTHCNAGSLATAGEGTALAVIYAAVDEGKRVRVFADETRPLLQGARLTAWELNARGIDVTVLCDGAAASAMALGLVNKVIVGADRIASNGDVANKVGTFPLALSAAHHEIPFYVAAPYSTLDPGMETGAAIPIEERAPDEVAVCGGRRVVPPGVRVWNPAFDVTPAGLVTAIITDRGVFRPPYRTSLIGARLPSGP